MTQERDGAIGDALTLLEAVVRARLAAGDAGASYVASLAAKGRGKIAQKLGEEATETVIAALTEDDAALTGEAADLVFHLTQRRHEGIAQTVNAAYTTGLMTGVVTLLSGSLYAFAGARAYAAMMVLALLGLMIAVGMYLNRGKLMAGAAQR